MRSKLDDYCEYSSSELIDKIRRAKRQLEHVKNYVSNFQPAADEYLVEQMNHAIDHAISELDGYPVD